MGESVGTSGANEFIVFLHVAFVLRFAAEPPKYFCTKWSDTPLASALGINDSQHVFIDLGTRGDSGRENPARA